MLTSRALDAVSGCEPTSSLSVVSHVAQHVAFDIPGGHSSLAIYLSMNTSSLF